MTSHSSTQWAPPDVLGALLLTAPSVCPSSCDAVAALQQPLSTRPYDGPPFDALASDFLSSPRNSPMPQKMSASVNITYLRSEREYPCARTALIEVPKSLSDAFETRTLRTTGRHELPAPSVTNRMCRSPPVSLAERL